MGVSQVRSRVEVFEEIRRDQRREGLSFRELSTRHQVHRRTVRQALTSPVPLSRAAYPTRACPAIGPWQQLIDGWLVADQDVPRKQRHTARRVWQRLVAEHQAMVSEVSRYVRRRRVELYVGLDGQPVKCWMFVMRLSSSGKAFHVAYGSNLGNYVIADT